MRNEDVRRSGRLDGTRARIALRRAARALGGAFAYFTILPAGAGAARGVPDSDALACLPIVGAITGALAGLLGWACAVWLHAPWAFVVAWAAGIVLTGAVHVDGFLDCCDALFVPAPAERRREILKDPRHGTFAVVGMVLIAAFWLAALAAIAPSRYPLVLAFAGGTARLASVANAWIFAYAPGGMSGTFAARLSPFVWGACAIGAEAMAWFVAPGALAILPAAIAIAIAIALWAHRRLGGAIGGDVYGAAIVVVEVGILAAISVLR